MKGTEKIIAHIRSDAEEQANAILAEAAEQAEPAVNVPLAALALKIPVRQHRAAFARAAYRKLHREHRHAHYKQADEIDQDEKAAAVLTRHKREAPDIADSDSAARADKQKA